MALSLLFFRRNSIFHIRLFLSRLLSHFGNLFDGHAPTITHFAACALFRALPILIDLI